MAGSFFDMDFGTGLVAGATTAFILFAAGRLWVHRLLPMLRRWRHRGFDLSGEWKGLGTGYTPAHGEWSELVLSLQQDVAQVQGIVTLQCRSAGHAFGVRLHARGTVTDSYLALNLSPADGSLCSPATALLKIEDRGTALNGQLLYRHPFLDIVDVIDMSVNRVHVGAAAQVRPVSITPAVASASEGAALPAGTVVD